MSIYTLEEYEAKLRSHDPVPEEEDLQRSVEFFREALEWAKELGQEQKIIDCRTGRVGIICYPTGGMEWVETKKHPLSDLSSGSLPLWEVRRGMIDIPMMLMVIMIAIVIALFLIAAARVY